MGEGEALDLDVVGGLDLHQVLQGGHDWHQGGLETEGRDPGDSGCVTVLGADELPRHVQDLPVVDHEVPQVPTADPVADWCVTQILLEDDLASPSLIDHVPDPGVLVDPGVEDEDLGLVEVRPVRGQLVRQVEAALVLWRTDL